jgi:hypothetical protein
MIFTLFLIVKLFYQPWGVLFTIVILPRLDTYIPISQGRRGGGKRVARVHEIKYGFGDPSETNVNPH